MVSPRGDLCGQDPQRRKARRPARRTAHKVRAGHQPQDCQGPRADDPALAPPAGGSGDRVMDRRTFLGSLAGGLLAAPLAVGAQQGKLLPRLGILTTGSSASSPSVNYEAFVQGLRESGYVDGRNVLLEQRYAEEKPKLFPTLAADLVRLKVDLIFARGPWAVRAASSATRTIPIVGID